MAYKILFNGQTYQVNYSNQTFSIKVGDTQFQIVPTIDLSPYFNKLNYYTGTTAPATYLKISNFNPYSASTLTNINSRLLTSAFNAYSANTLTSINGKLTTSAFNTYSGNTLTNINSRLLTSAFNIYSASTITTANNGLTKSGNNIHLGGALTGATTISGAFPITIGGTGVTTQMSYTPSSGLKLQGQSISLSGDGFIAQAIRGATQMSTGAGNTTLTFGYGSHQETAGTNYVYRFQSSAMNPASGNATINTLTVEPSINPRGTQSGGTFNIVNIAPTYQFTGRTNTIVGLLYAPTVTSMNTGTTHTAVKVNIGDIWLNSSATGGKIKAGKFSTGVGVTASIITTGETRSLGGFNLTDPRSNGNTQNGLFLISGFPTIVTNNQQNTAVFSTVGSSSTGAANVKIGDSWNPTTGSSSSVSSALNITSGIVPLGGAVTFKSINITSQINITTGSTWSGSIIGFDYNPLLTRTNGATIYGLLSRPAGALNGFGGGATLPTATLQVNGNGSNPTLKTVGAGTSTNYSVRNFQSDGVTEIYSLLDNGTFAFTPKIQGSLINGSWTASANNQSNLSLGGSFTTRNTANDTLNAVVINPTITKNVGNPTGQVFNALLVNPLYINTGNTVTQYILRLQANTADQFYVQYGGNQFWNAGTVTFNNPLTLIANGQTQNITFQAGRTLSDAFKFDLNGSFNTPNQSSNLISLFPSAAGHGINFGSGTQNINVLNITPIINNTNGNTTIRVMDYNPTENGLTGTTHYFITNRSTTAKSGFGLTGATAMVDVGGSSTSRTSLRIRSGTAPTSPNDGDIWYDGTNLKMRIGGTTKTFTLT